MGLVTSCAERFIHLIFIKFLMSCFGIALLSYGIFLLQIQIGI